MHRLKDMEADKALTENRLSSFIFYSIYANYHLSRSALYNRENGREDLAENIIESLKTNLEYIDVRITEVEIEKSKSDIIMMQIIDINKVEDSEIFALLNKIYLKLKFTSEEGE